MNPFAFVIGFLFLSLFIPFQIGAYYTGTKQAYARLKCDEPTGRLFALVMIEGGMLGVCVVVMGFIAACGAAVATSSVWGVALGLVALGCAGLGLWAGLGREKRR